ncbi:metallophosphoesterase [Fontisphaera persica]|uniref:metallophosphoesterase family protein n=1 Tax=Fontisphaera persica TaxID=2974023 RepID=UPI0024BFA102|nr:metallophosphoesterase [Fontisphaera persica]WCJ59478.1 metallophosphoesterase [Fontisphaera persica]
MSMSRRKALRCLSVGGIMAGHWLPAAAAAPGAEPPGTFTFAVLNDLHYLSPDCGKFLRGVLQQVRALQPELCLVLGDLTEVGRREDLAAVRRLLDDSGLRYYTVIGNHDYTAAGSPRYYKYFFPRRLNYYFRYKGWQWVGLDTSEGLKYENTRIAEETLAWADRLKSRLSPAAPTIVFTHFPLGPGVRYRPQNADVLLEKLAGFNVKAVFCGHFHGYTCKPVWQTQAYTNRCCALKRNNHDRSREKGFFLCEATPEEVRVRFVEVPVPPAGPAQSSSTRKPS